MARSLGGGGSSGGGSRSFGGSHSSGSRSFGGFHAGSSSRSTRRVSSGGSSSSSYRRSSGYYGGGLPPRPPRPGYGRSYYRRSYGGPVIINNGGGVPTGSGCGGGCLKTFLWIFLFVAIIGIIGSFIKVRDNSPSSYNTDSSAGYGCTKYTGEVDKSHGYWEDNSKGEPWIDSTNSRYLEEGFESFYDETGVWPYLYVTDSYGSSGNFATYEEAVYDQLFGDCPGNLLFVFIGNEESYYIAAGQGNGDVVNSKTIEVFENKVNKYWKSSSTNGDLAKIFGSAMKDAGKQLMKEENQKLMSKNNFKVIMVVLIVAAGVVIVLIIAMSWWQKKKKAQKEEDERLEQILSQPLSTFGNAELHDLGKKYDNVKVPASGASANTGTSATTASSSDSVLNAGGLDSSTTTVDTDSVLNHNNNDY